MGNSNSRRLRDMEANHARAIDQLRKSNDQALQVLRGQFEQTLKEIRENSERLQRLLDQPFAERKAKVRFVNGLQRKICQTNSLLLLGSKGLGKSTFLWLLGKGDKPIKTISDGTIDVLQFGGFADSIGLTGWSTEQLVICPTS